MIWLAKPGSDWGGTGNYTTKSPLSEIVEHGCLWT